MAGRTSSWGTSRSLLWLAHERTLAYAALLFAIGFNLYYLWPEAALRTPMLHDGVLHLLSTGAAVEAFATGRDPTDPWLAPIAFGFPLFHHYQHLSYLPPALLYTLLRGTVPLVDVYSWTGYLALSLFPLSIYWSMRRFGHDQLPAVLAGLAAPLVSTNALYGFDFASYVWRGYGLYTQLWGMLLLPPTLAQGYRALRDGRGYALAVALLAATLLSHVVMGYIALGSLVLISALLAASCSSGLVAVPAALRAGGRLGLLLGLLALVISYFLVPFLADGAYMNRGVWEIQSKYDSYGHAWVLGTLLRGELLDAGRFPSLTILAGIGLAACLRRRGDLRYRIPVGLTALWLLLYCGRPTWGTLLDVLPMSRDLHFHRLIAGVHLGGMYLIGLGLAAPLGWAMARRDRRVLMAVAALLAVLLYPAYRERAAFLSHNATLITANRNATASEARDVGALLQTLRSLPPGRVYAGLAATWGKDYRVGQTPVYALLTREGIDTLGFLYHSLSINSDVMVLFDERRREQYDLFNVRYVLAPRERAVPGFLRPIGEFGRHRLYLAETTGYFDLVGSDLTFVGGKGDVYQAGLRWLSGDLPRVKQHPTLVLTGGAPDPRRAVPLSEASRILPLNPQPAQPPRGRIVAESVEGGEYRAEVVVERESLLMLKATYHPGWRASVNGREAATVMLMPSYIGVRLEPGTYQVRLEYRSPPLRGPLIVFGLLVLALIAFAERRMAVRSAAPGTAASGSAATAEAAPPLPPASEPLAGVPGGQWVAGLAALARERTAAWGRWTGRGVFPGLAALMRPLTAAGERLGWQRLAVACVLLAALLSGHPLLRFKLLSGHDTLEYLPRNVEFWRALTAGQLMPRWAPDLSGGYGEPFFSFNPPLVYYLSALFHAFGAGFIVAENLACLTLLGLAGLGIYLLGSDLFGRRGGLLVAVAYLFAPYLSSALYVRHALADFAAFAFIPFAAWGLLRYVEGGASRFLGLGAVAAALILLSSNPVALFTYPALGLLVALLAWNGRGVGGLVRGGWCLALGLGLSAFFWLPALAEREYVHTHRLLESFLNYRNHFAYLHQLLYSPWGYGVSVPGPTDGMSFGIGPIHLGVVVAAIVLLRRVRAASPRAGLAVVFALVVVGWAAFMSVYESQPIWDRLPLLQYLEYPWRFHSLIAFGTALLFGFPFLLVPRDRPGLQNGLLAGLVVLLLAFNLPHVGPERLLDVREADYSPQNVAASYLAVTTAREYEPIWVVERPSRPAPEPVSVLEGRGRVLTRLRTPTESEFRAEITEEARLRLNTFYFPGWTLYVDGVPRPTNRANPQGLMDVWLEPGVHQLRLVFVDTPVRTWATRMSLLALLLLLVSHWLAQNLTGRRGTGRQAPRVSTGSMPAWFRRLPSIRRSQPEASADSARSMTGSTSAIASSTRSERFTAQLPFIVAVIVLAVLAGLPLLELKAMSGHDALIYLPATVELFEGLKAGLLYPRWLPDANRGYGEPFFNFLPPLVHYLSALFHALGFDYVASENLACLALFLLAGLGMYIFATEFFGRHGGLVAATAYLFAPFALVTLYVRHGLRDFAAFAFLPFAFWGLYRFAQPGGSVRFLVVGALSVALLELSSNSVALISFPAFGLFLLWLSCADRSLRPLVTGGICLVLGMSLSAFFWMPALAEGRFVRLDIVVQGWFDYRHHFLNLGHLIWPVSGYRYSLPGPDYGMNFAIGPLHLLMSVVALGLLFRIRRAAPRGSAVVAYFLCLMPLAVFFATRGSQLFWDRLSILHPLVFPWRVLSLIAVAAAFLCGAVFLLVRERPRVASVVAVAVIAGFVAIGLPHARPEGAQEISDAALSPAAIAARNISPSRDNFLQPIWVKEPPTGPPTEPINVVTGQGRILNLKISPAAYEFRVVADEQMRLQLSTVYFPGWTLYVDDAIRPVAYSDPGGLIEFWLEPGVHRVSVVFVDTPVRYWATKFSLLALLVLIASPWLNRMVRHRQLSPLLRMREIRSDRPG